jgi:predicted GNAT superfamily acetyltransferase
MITPGRRGTLDPMTDLASAPGLRQPGSAVTAEAAATEAAFAAGVEIVALEAMPDLKAVERLFGDIWSTGAQPSPVSGELMRALAHAGNYVAGAFDVSSGDRSLAGACIGFFGPPDGRTMHSHIAGVTAGARGRNVGYALKLHQHAWALRHGVQQITWTFDPLVSRNAYFNIAKLGATPTAYLTDFYGEMSDGINAGQGSDRLLVTWHVRPTLDLSRRDGETSGARVLLEESTDGLPVKGLSLASANGEPALVRVPRDIEQLRHTSPAVARSWRSAVGEVLGGLLAEGRRVSGFTRRGYYVVDGVSS